MAYVPGFARVSRARTLAVEHIRDDGTFGTDRCPSDRLRRIATDAGVRIVEASATPEIQVG